MKYAYYPGCSLHATAVDYDESTQAVAEALGIELVEVPDWSCCGSTPAHCTDELLAAALPAKNLLAAKTISNDVVVCCSACFSRFKFAQKHIEEKEQLRARLSEMLPIDELEGIKVRHFLDVLANDVGMEKIAETKRRDLGLKVACYYGCLLTRPPKVTEFDDAEAPHSMDDLLTAAGMEAAPWPFKTECCGATFSLTRTDIVVRLAAEILQMAKDAGADCISVACPLCHANLDLRQQDVEKALGVEYRIPVFYFTQLLGLAFGVESRKLGIQRAMVSSEELLASKGVE
ncbi:MAG: CoB--CoM heterodisulfide reductase iron-sulfur subunit B family protein [Planctomycetia bacterium]|nr:CoB--CoM heterodisulfide reductase iron-sulfur subunit B family protein [Planctomycetia bacterium]